MIFTIIAFLYVLFSLGLLWYWNRIPNYIQTNNNSNQPSISVVIAVRNEESTIQQLLIDLQNQTYDKRLFEIVIVDDQSEDNTATIISGFSSDLNIRLISNNDGGSKKSAISTAIKEAKNHLIVTTDGDCRLTNKWLEITANFYIDTNAKLIIGGVSFLPSKSLFAELQTIEFAALTGSGAALLQAGFPTMCNGANMAYERNLFQEVNGYAGKDHIASGDDEFLMHKAYAMYPDQVKFLKNKESVVFTKALPDPKSFIQQRKRWSSKWNHYQLPHIKWIAIFIFVCNLNFVIWGVQSLFTGSVLSFLIFFFLKTVTDAVLIRRILKLYERKLNVLYFLITTLIYPYYVSFFGLMSNKKGYNWKGRKHI